MQELELQLVFRIADKPAIQNGYSDEPLVVESSAGRGGGTAMPYDQLLAERVRRALEGRADMVERAMFGAWRLWSRETCVAE